jgi:hypothetical protein
MTKSTLARRAGALVVLAGLVYGPGARSASAAKPAPPLPAVPLVVTVEAFDSASNPCRICEDGLGNYENGIDGVTANFDGYGNLIINFNATETPIDPSQRAHPEHGRGHCAMHPVKHRVHG